jgi:predicted dehydrogenase
MKHYVLVGAGSRALSMFARPIAEQFSDSAALVGVYDTNAVRANYLGHTYSVPVFDEFDTMLDQTRPDCVIVATIDCYHHDYIIRALEAGCDAITEKPMTIDAEKCRAILAAEQRTGKQVRVIFNLRLMPYATRVKELLRGGCIGQILSVDLEWFLDTSHGADYFRRWHRRLENSGGLLVHKATHHFDMVNWWLEDEPRQVYAFGDLRVYGPSRQERGVRCCTCPYASTCEFYVDYASDPAMHALYFAAEHEDGYYRDGCVFADEIDIYDTMSVTVRYSRRALLTYSLTAYNPYEGWRASLTGTGGRMEVQEFYSVLPAQQESGQIVVFDRKGDVRTYDVPQVVGEHGGGDARLLARLFGEAPLPDPLGYMANARSGAMSLLIGAAANQAIATRQPVAIADLLRP